MMAAMDQASDDERYPTLSVEGRRLIEKMREHPAAPVYRNQSGNRLLAGEVASLKSYETDIGNAQIGWTAGQAPDWIAPFLADTYATVPFFRRHGSPPGRLQDAPTTSRADLSGDIASFVPDSVDLARLMHFQTTGTTGHPLLIPSHPLVAGRYLAFHKRAMARFGIVPTHGRGQVGVMLLGYQRRCFTYLSVTPVMDESGLAKINLHPDDWRTASDRAVYLDAMAPEVIAGDPISYAELLTLPMKHKPRVLLSVSMMLMPALRDQLEQRFGCPVLDIYSLNEVGPVAVFDPRCGGHLLLQPHLYVEIVDAQGNAVAPGQRGEITVTGGFNFCLPLVRYRTGDQASLAFCDAGPVLVGLSGRRPLRYRTAHGHWINNIDITHALAALALPHFGLHQDATGQVTLSLAPGVMALAPQAVAILEPLFGPVVVALLAADDKIVQYTSSLAGAGT